MQNCGVQLGPTNLLAQNQMPPRWELWKTHFEAISKLPLNDRYRALIKFLRLVHDQDSRFYELVLAHTKHIRNECISKCRTIRKANWVRQASRHSNSSILDDFDNH